MISSNRCCDQWVDTLYRMTSCTNLKLGESSKIRGETTTMSVCPRRLKWRTRHLVVQRHSFTPNVFKAAVYWMNIKYKRNSSGVHFSRDHVVPIRGSPYVLLRQVHKSHLPGDSISSNLHVPSLLPMRTSASSTLLLPVQPPVVLSSLLLLHLSRWRSLAMTWLIV